MDDMQMLADYAETGSRRAFVEIVNRHLGWIYAVCLRGLGDSRLAGDAAQAVFVLLARRAGRMDRETPLRGWLFQTSRFVVSHVLGNRAREYRKLATFRTISATHLSDRNEAAWEAIAPILDEAVSCLGPDDRQAILLRFYENHSMAEVGRRLGVTAAAAHRLVSHAVDKLSAMLSRQGASVSSATLVAVLLVRPACAMPEALAGAVIAIGTGETAASNSATAIAAGATSAMVRATQRLLAAITTGATAFVLLGGLLPALLPLV